jgi:hypothetical protein
MRSNNFHTGYSSGYVPKIKITKDLYNEKKYKIKIEGEEYINKKNVDFLKLLHRIDGFVGFTANKEFNSAFFYVKDNFCSLKDFLKINEERNGNGNGYNETNVGGCISYDEAVFMSDSLSQQMSLFADSGWGFYCFLSENVYVIDNHKFIYLGIEHFIEVKRLGDSGEKSMNFTVPFPEKTMIMCDVDINMNLFISPEIKNIDKLPSNVLYSCSYYHLASLIIYCMFHKNICFSGVGVGVGVDDGGVQTLSAIYNTKLYWFLIRCLHDDPSKRILLWI